MKITIENKKQKAIELMNKRRNADTRHTVRDCYARKSGATLEGIIVDARHAVRDCYVRK